VTRASLIPINPDVMETGHGQGGRPARANLGPPGRSGQGRQPGKVDVGGGATTRGLAREAASRQFWAPGTAGVTDQAPRPPYTIRGSGTGRSSRSSSCARKLGAAVGRPRWARICRMTAGRSMTAMTFIPDRKLETGAAGSEQAGAARDPRNRRTGHNNPGGCSYERTHDTWK